YITPKNGEELTDSITLHAPQAVGYIYGSYAEMNVEDSILTYTPAHGADANRDLLLTMKEICDYRAKLMKIILHTGEYVWDGSEFIPYPLMENTRGTGEEEIFTMARQLSATSFELGSLLTVTLDLSPFAGATMLSFSDKIPSGWSVTDAGGGQLAKDGSSLLFDYDIGETIPNSVTYTLQAPKLYAEPEYILALDSFKGIMDGDTITAQIADTPLQWRTPTPSLTVYSSGHLAKWRMNNGEWLPSGTPVSLAKGTPATLEVQLPEGNYLFGEWYALSNAVSLATPQEASISFTMPDESIVLKAKLLSAQNLALTDGWNLLAKTAEMSASPDFANQKVFILNQNTYCKVAFEKVPMAGVFWLYSANSSTKTFYYESVPNTYDYCPSIIGSGWQCIGSPDARLNCVLKPEDADNLFFWQKGMWHHCDNPAIDSRPLEAEQGYFLFK
ncbi:MAG: hypothetical protein J5746_02015, partial [Victivallales bacterium]|nr:hypothetical protein [Victivallales bacterium]